MIDKEGKQEVHPLKQIRNDLGLTQAQFAGLLDVQVTTVSRWETGQRQAELDLDQVVTIDLALAKLGKRISDYVVGQSPETQNA
jgi:transcriptional regulator with XRE-family HTH domain